MESGSQIFLEAFRSLATVGSVVISLWIGIRLLRLYRETRKTSELLLGLGFSLAMGLGYVLQMVFLVMRANGTLPWLATSSLVAGRLCHEVGATAIVLFTWRVFRGGERSAAGVAGLLVGVLWLGLIGYALAGGFHAAFTETYSAWAEFWWWFWFAGAQAYPLWLGCESFSHWARMRRRVRVGLADPVIASRFLWWGIGSCAGFAVVWMSVADLLIDAIAVAGDTRVVPVWLMGTMSSFVALTAVCYWFAFFPPAWYQRRFAAASTPSRA